jgi:type IV pilus assembly protein PilY1
MELDAMTGGRLSSSVLDVNDDGKINEGDFVEIDDPDNEGEKILVPVSGRKSEVGIVKTPAVIEAGTLEFKYFGGSDGQGGEEAEGEGTGIEIVTEAGGDEDEFGRRSWRQLR